MVRKFDSREEARKGTPDLDTLRQRRRELQKELDVVNQELGQHASPGLAPGAIPRMGGSFAPALDTDRVDLYRSLAKSAQPAIRDAVNSLCDMVDSFLTVSPEADSGVPHPSGRGFIRRLDRKTVDKLDPDVPYPHELRSIAELFDSINAETQRDLRDAAHHLLWYAVELSNDRLPPTLDQAFSDQEVKAMADNTAAAREERGEDPNWLPITVR